MGIDKNKIVKTELSQLKKIAKQVPADKLPVANSLVKELAFMGGTLAELKEALAKKKAKEANK